MVSTRGLITEVESTPRDGTLEGLVRRLRQDFPALAAEADAAVGHGVEKLIVRPLAPDDPRSYLAAAAYNEMKKIGRQRARCDSLEALAADQDDRPGWEPAHDGWTVEEQALLRATYDLLRAHVATWDTETVRVVTLLYLEASPSRTERSGYSSFWSTWEEWQPASNRERRRALWARVRNTGSKGVMLGVWAG